MHSKLGADVETRHYPTPPEEEEQFRHFSRAEIDPAPIRPEFPLLRKNWVPGCGGGIVTGWGSFFYFSEVKGEDGGDGFQ